VDEEVNQDKNGEADGMNLEVRMVLSSGSAGVLTFSL